MKTILALLFSCVLAVPPATAQPDSTQLKSAFGATVQLSAYRWRSTSHELVEKDSRLALDGGLNYLRFFGSHWYVQTGLEQTKRRTIRPVNDVESHVSEVFNQIPLLVGYGKTRASEGKFNRRFNLALGGYAAQLYRQGIEPLGSARIKLHKRENDYWKFGFAGEASVMLVPKSADNDVLHAFGFRSFIDVPGAHVRNRKSTHVFDNYAGTSFFYTLYFSSGRK